MIILILKRRKRNEDKNNAQILFALRTNGAQEGEEKRALRTPQQDTGTWIWNYLRWLTILYDQGRI